MPETSAGTKREVTLVVEDEDNVRGVTVDALRDLGYTLLQANGMTPALATLREHPEVMLLFTDIVMPDGNGRKLATEALAVHPGLKVLYTTGYTRDAIVHNGVLEPGVALITKPYAIDQLAAKIRDVLNPSTR